MYWTARSANSPWAPHELDKQGGRRKEQGADNDTGSHNHQAGAGKEIVGFLFLLFPQGNGDRHRGAHANEVCQGKVDDDEGHGQVNGGKSSGACKWPTKMPSKVWYRAEASILMAPGIEARKKSLKGGVLANNAVAFIREISFLILQKK